MAYSSIYSYLAFEALVQRAQPAAEEQVQLPDTLQLLKLGVLCLLHCIHHLGASKRQVSQARLLLGQLWEKVCDLNQACADSQAANVFDEAPGRYEVGCEMLRAWTTLSMLSSFNCMK